MFRFKQIAGILLNVVIFAVLLLAPAGTVSWPRAWLLLGVIGIASACSVFAIPEDLLDERYKLEERRFCHVDCGERPGPGAREHDQDPRYSSAPRSGRRGHARPGAARHRRGGSAGRRP